jgi:hypothetical protein
MGSPQALAIENGRTRLKPAWRTATCADHIRSRLKRAIGPSDVAAPALYYMVAA